MCAFHVFTCEMIMCLQLTCKNPTWNLKKHDWCELRWFLDVFFMLLKLTKKQHVSKNHMYLQFTSIFFMCGLIQCVMWNNHMWLQFTCGKNKNIKKCVVSCTLHPLWTSVKVNRGAVAQLPHLVTLHSPWVLEWLMKSWPKVEWVKLYYISNMQMLTYFYFQVICMCMPKSEMYLTFHSDDLTSKGGPSPTW